MSILDQFRQAIQGMNMGFQNTIVKPAQKAVYNWGIKNPQQTSQILRTTQPIRQQPIQLKPFQSQPIQSNSIKLQPFQQNSAPSASLKLNSTPQVSKPINVNQLKTEMAKPPWQPIYKPTVDTLTKIAKDAITALSEGMQGQSMANQVQMQLKPKAYLADEQKHLKLVQKISPDLVRVNPKTKQLESDTLKTVTAQIKGAGLVLAPAEVASMGLLNIPFKAAENVLGGKSPLDQNYGQTVAEGVDFGALFGPLSEVAKFGLSPILSKVNPAEIKTAGDVFKRLFSTGVEGGVGFGGYGAFIPAKDLNDRLNNIKDSAIQGAIFNMGFSATDMAGKRLFSITKNIIKNYRNLPEADKTKLLTPNNPPPPPPPGGAPELAPVANAGFYDTGKVVSLNDALRNAPSGEDFIKQSKGKTFQVPISDLQASMGEAASHRGLNTKSYSKGAVEISAPPYHTGYDKWIIDDGNHRVREAIARGEKTVEVKFSKGMENAITDYKKILDGTHEVKGGYLMPVESRVAQPPVSGTEITQYNIGPNDIVKTNPIINTKRDIPVTDIYGNKSVIPAGEALTPYELTGNKVLLKDGVETIVNKSQYQNVQNNAVKGEAQPFAPELAGITETILGQKTTGATYSDISKYAQEHNISESTASYILGGQQLTPDKPPKFNTSRLVLPGGTNYREILIQAPDSANIPIIESVTSLPQGGYRVAWKGGFRQNFLHAESEGMARSAALAQLEAGLIPNNTQFTSAHYSEKNIIESPRINDRTFFTSDNTLHKVTFLEESQSDWKIDERKSVDLLQKSSNMSKIEAEAYVRSNQHIGESVSYGGDYVLIPRYDPIVEKHVEMGIKRSLIEAVNSGSDYFSWANGEQVAARYDLAKYADNILWHENLAGRKQVQINLQNGNPITVDVGLDGKIIAATKFDVAGKTLDEFIGKGVAEKINASSKGTLPNSGLRIGGEWAKNLYDKQVKNIVENITGGKVESIDLKLPNATGTNADMQWGDVNGVGPLDPGKIKAGDIIRPQGVTGPNDWKILSVEKDGKFVATPNIYDAQNVKLKDISPDGKTKLYTYDDGSGWPFEREAASPQDFLHSLEISLAETFDIGDHTVLQQALKITPEIKARILGQAPQLKQPSGKAPELTQHDTSAAGAFNMTPEQAQVEVKKILGNEEFKLITGKEITAFDGVLVNGKYFDSILSVVEKGGKVEDKTVYHEAFHAYVDKLVNPDVYNGALKETMAAQNISEAGAREALAEDFANFIGNRKTFTGQVLAFFQDLVNGIKGLVGKGSQVRDLFNQARTGKVDQGMGQLTEQGFQARKAPSSDIAKITYDNTVKNGGVTIDVQTGEQPNTGFSYSPYLELQQTVPEAEYTAQHVRDYIAKNWDMLSKSGNYYGGWIDKGLYYLDVSQVGPPNAATLQKAIDAKQLGVFDLASLAGGPDGNILLAKMDGKVYNVIHEAINHPYFNERKIYEASAGGSSIGNGEVSPNSLPINSTELESARAAAAPSATLATTNPEVKKKRGKYADIVNPTDPYYNVNRLDISQKNKKVVKGLIEGQLKSKIEQVVGKPLTDKEVLVEARLVSDRLIKTIGRTSTERMAAAQTALVEKIGRLTENGPVTKELLQAIVTDKALGTNLGRLFQKRGMRVGPTSVTGRLEQQMLRDILSVNNDLDAIIAAAKGVNFDDPGEAAAFYRQFIHAKKMEWIDKLRYASMLSSPNTHMINMASNWQGTGIITPIQKTVEGLVDALNPIRMAQGKPRTSFIGEGLAYAKGYYNKEAVSKGIHAIVDVLSGRTQNTNPDTRFIKLATTTKGKIFEGTLDAVSKPLEAMDQFFRALTESGLKASYEYKKQAGNLDEAATDEAYALLFRGKLTGEGQGVVSNLMGAGGQWVKQATLSPDPGWRLLAKFTFPFVNIGTNLAKAGLEYNPVFGLINLKGNSNKTAQVSKVLMGGVVTAVATMFGLQGRLHAWAPADPEKRKAMQEANLQPWSIDVETPWGPQNVLFSKMHPALAFQLGMVAAFMQAIDEGTTNEDKAAVAMAGLGGSLRFIGDQSYFKNINDFSNMLNGDPTSFTSLISNYPQQLIPFRALQGWITRIVDDYQRTPNPDASIIEKVMQRIEAGSPFMYGNVPIKLNQYGQPLKNENKLFNAISPGKVLPINQTLKTTFDLMQQKALSNKLVSNQTAAKQKVLASNTTDVPSPEQQIINKQNTLKLGIVDNSVKLSGQSGQVGDVYKFWDKSANQEATIDLGKVLSPETGIGAYKRQNNIYATGRTIWNSDLPQASKLEALQKLKLNPEDVRYDTLAAYTVDEKTGYFINDLMKGQDHATVLDGILTGRVESISGNMFITDTVLKNIYDAGLISKGEYNYYKSIKTDKNGNTVSTGTGSGSSGSIKALPKYPSMAAGAKLKFSNLKLSPMKIKTATVTKAKMPGIKTYTSKATKTRVAKIKPMANKLSQLGTI